MSLLQDGDLVNFGFQESMHQIRNSIKFVASKNQKEFMVDLKTVYQAEIKDLAEYNLLKLDENWGNKY